MKSRCLHVWLVAAFALACWALPYLSAQSGQDDKKPQEKKELDPKGFEKKDFFGKKEVFFGGPPMMQQRKILKQFDKNGDGWLNAEERVAAREFIKKQPAPGPGGFGMKGPGGFKGKGPGGMMFFGPGSFMTKPLIEVLDKDNDGFVNQAEFLDGVKKFFRDSDKDNRGKIDEKQLVDALSRVIPGPPNFGPPGFPPQDGKGPEGKGPGGKGPDGKGPGGFGGPSGFPGGPGLSPAMGLAGKIMKRADADKDGKLTLGELTAAAESFFKEVDRDKKGKLDEGAVGAAIGSLMQFPAGPGGPMFGKGGMREPAKPGPHVDPADVKAYPKAALYDTSVLRTFFFEFENKDWEAELQDFRASDVEVPATLIVDGKRYPNVGVHFRGMSSYMGVPAGYKRSMGVSLTLADSKQRLYGFKTLNLLNSHDDPSLMHTVLYSHISQPHLPTPRANFVKVVINGESWGIYANAEQFNKDFLAANFKTTQGARWHLKGSPGGRGGLDYLGDNVDDYKRIYTIKTKDNDKDWKALIALCRTLSETPLEQLEEALRPMLDIDGVLWFLALDNALINDDGYWVRASDYNLYRDPKGKFHLIAHDINETFGPAMGFGFGPGMGKGPKGFGGPKDGPDGPKRPEGAKGEKGGPDKGGPKDFFLGGPKGGPGVGPGLQLDPLIGMNDARKPLRGRLLQVPSLRAKYLQYVREIAEKDLDWKNLGPVVAKHRALIEKEVELDTRKLYPLTAFKAALADGSSVETGLPPLPKGGVSLKAFAEARRSYLLNHPEIRKLASPQERKGAGE